MNINLKLGFLPLLGFLFIGLKLAGTIAWSWWWVLAPFWIWPAILAVCGLVYAVCCGIEQAQKRASLRDG